MWFKAISNLKINVEKSELFPIGEVANVEVLVVELGCRVGNLLSSYLGLPSGTPFKEDSILYQMKERFKRKLSMWKRQYILKGGRLTLIRSILSSLLIYYMILFTTLEKKLQLVNWSILCREKMKRELDIESLSSLNRVLFNKWS